MRERERGDFGERIAEALWPSLQKTTREYDKRGIDHWCRATGRKVQVKTDEEICFSGNLYFEVFEKDKGHSEQKWRLSPHECDDFIFVTHGYAVRVPVWMLAEMCIGQNVQDINSTSMGFLVSVCFFEAAEWRDHDLWPHERVAHARRMLHWYFRRK